MCDGKIGGIFLEIKVNKEILNYTESIFFGLSMRQFFFSVLACAFAVLVYFLLQPYFGLETLSWLCILAAAPFAALGFVTYNGMVAEQIAWAYIKTKFLIPSRFPFESENLYSLCCRDGIEKAQKGALQ